jgi:fatty acid desaturase
VNEEYCWRQFHRSF